MTKTVKIIIGAAFVAAVGAGIYILTQDKKIVVDEHKELKDKIDDLADDISDFVEDKVDDISDYMEDKVDDFNEFVETAEVKIEQARDKVEEVTKDVVNRISRELAKANNYDIPPYEISHETYIQPMSDEWKKVTVFYDNGNFHGIYGEEYKPFVLGEENVENFISTNTNVMYIRNENLECDYALYKGEENG